MSSNRYIIREWSLGYDDEVYYDVGYTIHDVYSDKKKAEKDLRKLQLGRVKMVPLSETASLFNGSEALLQDVEKYIKEKTGVSVLDGGDYIEYGTDLPDGMSDDELLELGKMIDTLGYEIIKLAETHMLYVLWNTAENEPYLNYDESGEFMIYAQSEEKLLRHSGEIINNAMDDEFSGNGTYEQLSDTPELLKSLVESSEALKYNQESPAIELHDELDASTLQSLNGLLKEPFYSIKEMNTQQIVQLEKEMSDY